MAKKMRASKALFFLFSALCLLASAVLPGPTERERTAGGLEDKLGEFFSKPEVTIAVTDSGLGGLAVMAEAAARMEKAGLFRKVDLIFFNALFSNELGYNSLPNREEKIRIFNAALESLEKNHRPDLVLIACNTLSVIYEDTPFSRKTGVPVAGIVDPGVELVLSGLKKTPDSRVILFATETTVEEDTHRKKLIETGIRPERIVTQACPELVEYIEKGYRSEETEMLIAAYVDEALKKLPAPPPPLLVSLNCTHYGYSLELWEKAFRDSGIEPRAFLNPNSRMLDFLFENRPRRHPATEVRARVVSMVEITRERIESIGEWLAKISPLTAEALEGYEFKPGLFSF